MKKFSLNESRLHTNKGISFLLCNNEYKSKNRKVKY